MQAIHPTSERVIEQKVEISSTQRCGCDWRIGVVALAALATLTSLFLLPWPATLCFGLVSAAVITWLYADCCIPSETLASCNRSFFGIFPSFRTVTTRETVHIEPAPPVYRYAERDVPPTRVQLLRAQHPVQGRQTTSRKRVELGGQVLVRPAAGSKLAPSSVSSFSTSQTFLPRQMEYETPPPTHLPPGAKLPPSSVSSFSTSQPFPPRKRVESEGQPSIRPAAGSKLAPPSISSFSTSQPFHPRQMEYETPPPPSLPPGAKLPPSSASSLSTAQPFPPRKRVEREGQPSVRPAAGSKLAPSIVGSTQVRKRTPLGE